MTLPLAAVSDAFPTPGAARRARMRLRQTCRLKDQGELSDSGFRERKPANFFSPLQDLSVCVAAALLAPAPERRCSSRTFRYGYLVTT